MKYFVSIITIVWSTQLMAAPFNPQTILKDGEDSSISINPYTQESGEARKGTIAATLNNAAKLNQILLQSHSEEREEEIKAIVAEIDRLIPSLRVVGMFDFFEPIYWIGQGEQLGRIVVVALYFKHYPEKSRPDLREKISSLTAGVSSPCLQTIFS